MKTGRFNTQIAFSFLPEECVILYCTFPQMLTGTWCWQNVAVFLSLCLKTKVRKLKKRIRDNQEQSNA